MFDSMDESSSSVLKISTGVGVEIRIWHFELHQSGYRPEFVSSVRSKDDMKQYLPRCNVRRKQRHHAEQQRFDLPPPKFDQPCCYCGERSVYCTFKRKNNLYVCENCFRKNNVVRIAKKKQWLWDHKAREGCILCHENDPSCLDYHHLQPKKKKFSIGSIPSTIPTQAIQIEMRKCVVVCANCHRKIEYLL
jgi:hypothetical protein